MYVSLLLTKALYERVAVPCAEWSGEVEEALELARGANKTLDGWKARYSSFRKTLS